MNNLLNNFYNGLKVMMVMKECQVILDFNHQFIQISIYAFKIIGRQGSSGPPGRYDPTLDEISSGPIGPQGIYFYIK